MPKGDRAFERVTTRKRKINPSLDETMYNGQIIKQLLAERNIPNKELLKYLGTEANSSLSQITNGNPTVKRLERVADFFGISMDTFFEREKPYKSIMPSGNNNELFYKEKIELLEKLIKEKDERIKLLENVNQLLMSDKNRTNTGQQ